MNVGAILVLRLWESETDRPAKVRLLGLCEMLRVALGPIILSSLIERTLVSFINLILSE